MISVYGLLLCTVFLLSRQMSKGKVFMAMYTHTCEVILALLADINRSCMTKSLYIIYTSYYLNYL